MKTGVLQMSVADYFSAHGVSQSRLKLMSKSPAHMKYAMEHPEPSTPDQILGHIFDAAVFDPTAVADLCYIRPAQYDSGKEGMKPWHGGAKVCKEWSEAHKDKPAIPQEDVTAVQTMVAQVLKHPAAREALTTGQSGLSFFCEDAETGLQLKGRPDWLSGNVILDLKSCQDASRDGFAKSVANFGYDVQAAFYLDLAAILNQGKEHFLFIACEKDPPFAVAVYELDDDSIAIGRQKYRKLLTTYMQCVAEDRWPGYPEVIQKLSLPKWAIKAFQN